MKKFFAEGARPYSVGFAHPEYEMRSDEKVTILLDDAVRLGASWFRTDAFWADIEPSKGTYQWSSLDRIVSSAEARNLRVILTAHTMPAWASGSPSTTTVGPVTAAQISAYASFCAALASRYPSVVIEVWNEPNLDQFWSPTPNPSDYSKLLSAAYSAIKGVSRGTTVLGGCFGGATSEKDVSTFVYLDGMIAAGALDNMDAISIHPYDQSGRSNGGLYEASVVLKTVRKTHPNMMMWGTEHGCNSSGAQGQSENVQARAVIEAHRLWRFIQAGGPLCWYTIRDGISDDVGSDSAALLHPDGKEKRGAEVMRAVSKAELAPGWLGTIERIL